MRERRLGERRVVPFLLIVAAAASVLAAVLSGRGCIGVSRRGATGIAGDSHAPEVRTVAAGRASAKSHKRTISYADARPVLDVYERNLPTGLGGRTPNNLEAAWPDWVARRDGAIRARLQRGDEDSVINLWLYGTTFTTLPRATPRDLAKLGGRDKAEALLVARLNALVDGIAAPGANERLRFAREVVERKGIDLTTEAGKQQARIYLAETRERAISESARNRRLLQSATVLDDDARLKAYGDAYRDRGLSSDTSMHVDFAVDAALQALREKGAVGAGSVRRVAIVGPGLDFTDKIEGYDFYPQQTIQPFALADSLIRAGLAHPDALRVVTFDVSPRVNQHLETARERARSGAGYVLQLPLDLDVPGREWRPELVSYWLRLGGAIGDAVDPIAAPRGAEVRVRAVRVRPPIVLSIVPHDLNIVLERLEPIAGDVETIPNDDGRFDLIVATNVLVYYDAFEQALALANIARMLRPRALFLTNYVVAPVPSMEPMPALTTKVYWDRQHNGDTVLAYRRR